MTRESIRIQWSSPEERLACFDALIVLAERGCLVPMEAYQKTMTVIMERPVWTIELGTTGVEHLRNQLTGKEDSPNEILGYHETLIAEIKGKRE